MQQPQLPFTLAQAVTRGEQGMVRAEEHANRVHCGWGDMALARLLKHVQTLPRTQVFIIEDIRLIIEVDLPEPPDLRSWGSVTRRAIGRLYIIPTGEYAPAKSSNASDKPLYRRGGAV